jgi:hypothetical protein
VFALTKPLLPNREQTYADCRYGSHHENLKEPVEDARDVSIRVRAANGTTYATTGWRSGPMLQSLYEQGDTRRSRSQAQTLFRAYARPPEGPHGAQVICHGDAGVG